MSTWEKPQSNVEEETIQNDDEEIATVVVLSENDSGSGLLLFPSQEEVMSMVAEFPNWASIFDVEILHAVTEVGSEVNPLHYGETQREEVYSRAWRREDVLILKETAKSVEVVDVEEEEEEITSSVNELRSSYEQYWEEVRHGVDVSMNASSDSGEYIKYVQHQAPMNLEEDKNIREVAAFLREDLQEESNVRGGAGGDPSYHEKMETMMMSMGTMTTSTWTVLSSSYVSLDGSSLSRLIGALRTTSRARVVLLLLLFIFVSPVRDYVHVTSERPVQFQTTTTFVSTVQTRTKQSVSIGSASSSNIGSKDGRMGKEVEKEKEIGHVVDTEIITPIVESTSGAAPATAPKVVAPKIVAPKIVTPKSVAPKSVTPKNFSPKSVTPKSVTPELAAQVIPSSLPVAPIAAPVVTAPVVAAPVVAAPVVAAPVVAAPVVAAPVVAAPVVAAPVVDGSLDEQFSNSEDEQASSGEDEHASSGETKDRSEFPQSPSALQWQVARRETNSGGRRTRHRRKHKRKKYKRKSRKKRKGRRKKGGHHELVLLAGAAGMKVYNSLTKKKRRKKRKRKTKRK